LEQVLLLPQSKLTKLACPKQFACVGEFVAAFVGDVMHELSNSCVILTHCTQSLQPHTDAMPVAGVTTPTGKPGKSCIVDLMGLLSVPEQSVLV
jgi:hypothetical protein